MKTKYIEGFDNVYIIDTDGNIYSKKSNRYLTPSKDEYPRIKLSKNNKDYVFSVHRLVAETFLDNLDNKQIINHKDGNKKNYKLDNLEWVTQKENSQHAHISGLKKIKYGISSKLSEFDVAEIFNSKDNISTISKKYGICRTTVYNIKNKKNWYNIDKLADNLSTIKNSIDNNIFDFDNSKIIINHNNYKIDINGNILNINTNNTLKTVIKKNYKYVYLQGKNYSIHRLVALHFIENCDINKNIVNHKDGNKINNNLYNLEWVNSSENSQHVVNNGLKKINCGVNIGTSKLKDEIVIKIFNLDKKYKEISKEYNISIGTVSMIKNKKIWKHLLIKN
jgi:uncharacterized protein YerC